MLFGGQSMTPASELLVSDEDLWAAYQDTPSSGKLAKIYGISERQIRRRLAQIRDAMGVGVQTADPDRAGKLEMLVSSIPLNGPGGAKLKEASVKLYGIGAKDELTQKIVREGLDSVGAVYKFTTDAPKFPLIQPANPSTFAYYSDPPRIMRKIRREVVISDAQIGFLRYSDQEKIPTHDPDAIDIALQIVSAFQPDGLSWIGDWVDIPMFSRWPKKPEFRETTQPSIQAAHDLAGEFIAAAGPQCTKRRFVLGNHDDRLALWARDQNLEAMNLSRASDTSGWPVFSTPFLLRFDELGIEVTQPYPSGEAWLTDDLVLMHAPPKKLEMAASVIHGHLHKLTRTTWAQTNREGRLTYFLYDCGCLCKIDGLVPSDRARTDWANGIGIVEIIDGKIPVHNVELVHIQPERTLFRGAEFRSSLLVAA